MTITSTSPTHSPLHVHILQCVCLHTQVHGWGFNTHGSDLFANVNHLSGILHLKETSEGLWEI